MPMVANPQITTDAYQRIDASVHADMVMKLYDVERFLAEWSQQNHSPQTVKSYRTYLIRFYDFLPESHIIHRDTVLLWREHLLRSGYAPVTVNLHISACNTWLEYMGRREYQLLGRLNGSGKDREALTREEYFRLLLAARANKQERLFLMIKVFGSTGLYANELNDVTLENVQGGGIPSTGKPGHRRKEDAKDGFPGGPA